MKSNKKSSGPLKGLQAARYGEPTPAKGPRKSDDPTKGLKEAIKAKQVTRLALRAASLK